MEHPSDGLGIFGTRKKGEACEYIWGSLTPTFDYSPDEIGDMMSRHRDFNTPTQDNLDFIVGEHFCAYRSIEQIQQWITKEEFIKLFTYGFKVYMIDVSECQIGNDQVIYKKEHILQQKDISSLFQ
jgi:hypothetical protein